MQATWRRHVPVLLACVALATATVAAYWNSLPAPFVLDDEPSIIENPSIRSMRSLPSVLNPPNAGGLTVEGRPVLNLSLALNYAASGLNPAAFRATNIAFHVVAGLLLFGVIRLTMRRLEPPEAVAGRSCSPRCATWIALSAAAVWLLHPVQTAAVTYVIQRAESLAALFVLLSLFGFALSLEGASFARRAWQVTSIAACFLGIATKESAAAIPLIVLLYDRAFVSGGFRAAWSLRRGYYSCLCAAWLLLAALVAASGLRSGSAGWNSGVSPWAYALTQCEAIVGYARTILWPNALVFDHGTPLHSNLREVWSAALAVAGALLFTVFALIRAPRIGFLAAAGLLLLAPSSSIVPVATQTIAEHRLYLPLAAAVLLVGAAAWRALRGSALALAVVVAGACLSATVDRNQVYLDEIALWRDTVAKRPANTRARNNLALLLREQGRPNEALAQLDAALQHEPGSIAIHNNRANVLADLRRFDEACAVIDRVIQAAPGLAEAHDTKADILRAMGRHRESERARAHALHLKPSLARGGGGESSPAGQPLFRSDNRDGKHQP